MPNLIAHYACGKLIQKKLNDNSKDFLKGCILPDYIENAHFKTKGKKFLIPDIDKFLEATKMNNSELMQGYLTHLLLDKYFLEEYVLENIYDKIDENENIFEKDKIYLDYTIISPELMKHFDISLDELIALLPTDNPNINIGKYKETIKEIITNEKTSPKYLQPESFITFIEETSDKIIKNHLRPSSR